MRDDIDLWIADEKVCHETAHCELHGGHSRGAAHGAGRFIQPMAYGGLSQFTLPGVSGRPITALALSTDSDGVCAGDQWNETGAAHISVAPTTRPNTLSFFSNFLHCF